MFVIQSETMKLAFICSILLTSTAFVTAVLRGDSVASKPYYARVTFFVGNSPIEMERGGAIITTMFILTLGDANGAQHTIMAHVGSALRTHQTAHPVLSWLTIPMRDGPGLLQLVRPLTFNNRVRPIRLTPSDQQFELPGVQGMVLGMTRPPTTRDNLQAAFMRVVSSDNCALNYPGRHNNQTVFCAFDGETHNDFCESDRGAPMTIVTREQEFLVGIAMEGVCLEAQHVRPSLFVRVSHYRSVIEDVINGISNNLKEHHLL